MSTSSFITQPGPRIVVTGIGIVSPVGCDAPSTWDAIVSGTSGIAGITRFDPAGYQTTFAGEVKHFDPIDRLGRKDARRTDRYTHFAVASALEALERAGLAIDDSNADRVGVLKAGRLIAEGAPSELISTDTATRVSFELPDGTSVDELDTVLPAETSVVGARVEFSTRTPTAAVAALTGWAAARGIELPELSVTRPTLEDVFLELVADEPPPDGSTPRWPAA